MTARPVASVVVNTIDRADALSLLLRSLQHQWFDDPFEVVVVTGPCTDHTDEVLAEWEGRVKHLRCPEANLSRSRNIGIAASAGDVVVFIDDDAVPEPRWLAELLAPFDDPEVAATGGYVWDHTGTSLQCRFNRCDRLGRASFHAEAPLDDLCVPGSAEFPYVPGGNGAWRRRTLLAVGGFDEHYEYYLDEVDVAVRAVDAGWRLVQVPGAAIHHKFLPSSVRTSGKVLTNRYPVIKNKVLFGLFNAGDHASFDEVLAEAAAHVGEHRRDVEHHVTAGTLDPSMPARFEADAARAVTDAVEAGTVTGRRLGGAAVDPDDHEPLLPFPTVRPDGLRRRYVFVSQAIPPDPIGGIGRYMLDVAQGLAAEGHEVRLLTDGTDHDTVDLESGVWIHRLVKPDHVDDPVPATLDGVPPRIWANAVRVEEEVARLAADHPVDAVYAAVWDTEAVAVQQRGTAPVAVALVTSLALALESDPTWAKGEGFLEDFALPMVEVERQYLRDADLVHAISDTILAATERSSDVVLDRDRVVVGHLGTHDPLVGASGAASGAAEDDGSGGGPPGAEHGADDGTRLLFVGKFERRKGIDLLLDALALLLPDAPGLTVTLVGRNDLVGPDGGTWVEWFDARHGDAPWRSRVEVLGEVDDDELDRQYRRADLFVAPSRFESFGLIYVEAMAHGLPVVALGMGAATEVVDESSGVLVGESAEALAAALGELVRDPGRRAELGRGGRARFLGHFTTGAMVDRVRDVLARTPSTARHATADRAAAGAR